MSDRNGSEYVMLRNSMVLYKKNPSSGGCIVYNVVHTKDLSRSTCTNYSCLLTYTLTI